MYWREKNVSWWEQELPKQEEIDLARFNLEKYGNKVDYIITHCCPSSVASSLGYRDYDILTEYFNEVSLVVDFKHWYFGHYHEDITDKDNRFTVVYHKFIKL